MTSRQIQVRRALMRRLEMLKAEALAIVRATAPYRKGDLSNSFQLRMTDDGFEIYTNIYYMPFTNEAWIHPRWRGRENPNLNWFDQATKFVKEYIERQLGGEINVSNNR